MTRLDEIKARLAKATGGECNNCRDGWPLGNDGYHKIGSIVGSAWEKCRALAAYQRAIDGDSHE